MGELDFNKTELSGQVALPGFVEILDCEAAALSKAEHEVFCAKYVEFGGDSAKAYQLAINSDVTDRLAAQKNAHKLLKRGEIRRRITEISAVYRNRTIHSVIAFQLRALNFKPSDLYSDGKPLGLAELPEGTGVEAKIVDGCLRYIPVFPSPQKAAESLAKIMSIEKQLVELTGAGGGPVAIEVSFVKSDKG